jgi:hypothetical protein
MRLLVTDHLLCSVSHLASSSNEKVVFVIVVFRLIRRVVVFVVFVDG